jgi:uncharacterized protein YndB with AHSA1/START domain
MTGEVLTSVEGQDLLMERVFNAPRELLFETFSTDEHLARWWGPQGWQTENRAFEFKPDGVWHYVMRCTDESQGEFFGLESWGKAVYHEIVAPEKIVYTDSFSDEEGNIPGAIPDILVTMNFVDEGDKTRLLIRSHFSSIESLKQVKEMGIEEGFASQLERLDVLLEELKQERK